MKHATLEAVYQRLTAYRTGEGSTVQELRKELAAKLNQPVSSNRVRDMLIELHAQGRLQRMKVQMEALDGARRWTTRYRILSLPKSAASVRGSTSRGGTTKRG